MNGDLVSGAAMDGLNGLAALCRRDPSLPGLDVLLDADRLSEAIGQEVRLTRVRYKPGSSVVVAFRARGADTSGGGDTAGAAAPVGAPADACGWAASYANDDKAAKTLRRATAERPVRRVPALPHAITGGVFADRALGAGFDALVRRDPALLDEAAVLRHNPHRRVLLAAGSHIVKVAAASSAVVESFSSTGAAPVGLQSLASRGVPLLVPERWGDGITATTRWGNGDLSVHASDEHAALAGVALASLHEAKVPAGAAAGLAGGGTEVADAVAGLAALHPSFEAGARRVAAAVPTGSARVIIHGDFSSDQVLTGDGIRLIDFDRAGYGDAHRDLGTFFAAELLATGGAGCGPALLDGYRAGGGSVDGDLLRRWTAVSLLLRAAEPFRAARPDWHGEIARTLRTAEGMLS